MKMNRRDVLKGAFAASAAGIGIAGIESAQALETLIDKSKPSKAELEEVAKNLNKEFKDLPHEEVPEGFTLLPITTVDVTASALYSAYRQSLYWYDLNFEKDRLEDIDMYEADFDHAMRQPVKYMPTYSEHEIEGSGSTLLNVGVNHRLAYFHREKVGVYHAINSADIVLLESGMGYFPEIKRFAESMGKKVEYVDYPVDVTVSVANFANALVVALALLPERYRNNSIANELLRKLLIVPVYKFSTIAMVVDAKRYKVNSPTKIEDTTSFVTDGRTVRMLASALDIASQPENKGKRLSIITGDTHAEGIDAYMKNQKLFNIKRRIYDIIYAGALFHKSKVLDKK